MKVVVKSICAKDTGNERDYIFYRVKNGKELEETKKLVEKVNKFKMETGLTVEANFDLSEYDILFTTTYEQTRRLFAEIDKDMKDIKEGKIYELSLKLCN